MRGMRGRERGELPRTLRAGAVLAATLLAACGGGAATLPGLDATVVATTGAGGGPVPDPAARADAGAGAPPEAAPLPEGSGPPDASRIGADWRAGLAAWYACLARPAGCDARFAAPGSGFAAEFGAEMDEARAKALVDADGPAAHRVVLREATPTADGAATVVACAYDRRRFTLGGFGWEVRNWTTRMTWELRWHAGAWRWAALDERITHVAEDGCGDGA